MQVGDMAETAALSEGEIERMTCFVVYILIKYTKQLIMRRLERWPKPLL